jgi:ADP-heptose:LPS heptosyltransferase
MFLAQDYPETELVIVDDGFDSVADIVPAHPAILYVREEPRGRSLGAKRNLACELARGEIVLHWDDDDWYAPWRVRYQVETLVSNNLDLCSLNRAFFVDAAERKAWEYVQSSGISNWLCGATLCYRRSLWEKQPFADVKIGEDSRFVVSARRTRIAALEDNRFFVCRIHANNTASKRPRGRWPARPFDAVRSIVGVDWEEHFGGENGLPLAPRKEKMGVALISAASGIGDILRVTPLIRAAHRLGYDIDVLLAPDDPAVIELLVGAPEIRRIFSCQRALSAKFQIAEIREERYDIAAFTALSAPLAKYVTAARRYTFGSNWRHLGDYKSVERLARAIGWNGDLPAPFAIKSARRFDIPFDTIALHPGCKPNWPWKKWHGFDQLASLFENVVLVGTTTDLDNSRTYFKEPFSWPEHVYDFVGKLSLPDTAALISQCSALVSPDSGLMHLGVTLCVPTFGIFGLTSPKRECIASPYMTPISRDLPCEPDCRRTVPGRNGCRFDLECLKTLTPQDVAACVRDSLSTEEGNSREGARGRVAERKEMREPLKVNYFGEVSYSSGYGEAARGYVHALNAAGVEVRVIDLGGSQRHVADELVSSLLGREHHADFNIFHGIPSFWARRAYRLRNVIAVTVWEADEIPQIWRNPLSHAIDVWVPSTSSVEAFSGTLQKSPFRLPHALLPRGASRSDTGVPDANRILGVAPGDFVLYSIFEWQERKNPDGLMRAFLEAFPERSDAVLVIKAAGNATQAARDALERIRLETGSRGRVLLQCAQFDQSQMEALHDRGDCYVSLHRGEGWGYPLFEAASRGTPVVATAYGGPLDYLDPERHRLVRCNVEPVRRPYFLYEGSMKWAEPDLNDAQAALRWTYEHRAEARSAAAQAALKIQANYSLKRIGEAAARRLVELKEAGSSRSSATSFRGSLRDAPQRLSTGTMGAPTLPQPIPGEWYDADYFEHGRKSNWAGGYSWSSFGGLFAETAAFLQQSFPEATSYLDAGCAKGFLVRALRDRGLSTHGFDHSPWAFDNALEDVKVYIDLASVDTVEYADESFDVLTAMSLFESLTNEQLNRFLLRARRWVRQTLFVTIPIQSRRHDHDLSHITSRDCSGWSNAFAEAGWLKAPEEAELQRHPLARRMRWNVFVLIPSS